MPITLRRSRSSSSSNLKLWEKRTRSSSLSSVIRSNTSNYQSLLPPSTPTTTATKSHPITPPKPISPRDSQNNNNNTSQNTPLGNANTTIMGGGSNTSYGEVTEILMGGFHPSSSDDHDDASPARRNSLSNSISRRRSRSLSRRGSRQLEYQNPDHYGGQSTPFPKDEGIEAILPPSVRNSYQKPPLPQPTNERDHSQRRSRWTCLTPKMFEQAVPPVLTAASSSEESGQERQRTGPSTGDESNQQQQQQQYQCDYAFDADVWNASPSRGGDIDKNEVSLVDTTFISNSSASTTSSPHPDPIATLSMAVDDNVADGTTLEDAKTKKKSSSKWKKRLKFWKSRPKEKRSSSLEPMGTSTIGGGSPSRKELPNTSDWMLDDQGPLYDDNNGDNETHSVPWEPHFIEGDQVECEYRGNISLQDWFLGQADGNIGGPIVRTPSFELMGLSSADGEHNENVKRHECNTLSLGEEEGSPKVAENVSYDCTGNTVMELGQYARTMQSKPSRTLSPKTKSKGLGSSLLCALPGLGKKLNKEEKDLASENFPDPGDEILDYESDNNSYLAVSYTEECAQLVMQQSEDLQDMPPVLEPQPEAPLTHDAQPQSPSSHDLRHQMSPVHDDPPQMAPIHDDPPQMAHLHNLQSSADEVETKRGLSPFDHPPQANTGFEDTGYMGDDPGIFRADTDLMSDDLQFLAEHSVRSQSIKTISNSTLGASFGHPAAQLRDDFVAEQRVRHPPPFKGKNDEDPSEKLFKAITQGLPMSESSLSNTVISKVEESPSDTKARTMHAPDVDDFRPFEREVVGGITYHHYKATAPPPPPPPPPPLPAQNESSAKATKAAKTPDDFSNQTPSPIRTMRSNLLNNQKKKSQDANVLNSHEENTQAESGWVLQRRDDPPAQVPDDEAKAQAQAAQMYRYYCPADTSSSYRASLAETSAKYRTAISDTTSKYRGACTPSKIPAFELSQPTELSWDNSTAPTLGSRSMSTLSYSEMKYPRGQRATSLAPTAADIWDVYRPVKQMAKEVGESLCENVYARRGQPSTVPFDEMHGPGSHRRPWAQVRKSGNVNYYDNGYRKGDKRNDDHPWRERRRNRHLSQDEASIYSGEGSKPDPPSVFSEHPDTRRQLL